MRGGEAEIETGKLQVIISYYGVLKHCSELKLVPSIPIRLPVQIQSCVVSVTLQQCL
jgi:hypothetical protein